MKKTAKILAATTLALTFSSTQAFADEGSNNENSFQIQTLSEEQINEQLKSLGSETVNLPAVEVKDLSADAGLTPASGLYFLDRLVEDIQLAVTSDKEKEATLLNGFSMERLAEIQKLPEEERATYIKELTADFTTSLGEVDKVVETTALSGEKLSDSVLNQTKETSELGKNLLSQFTGQLDSAVLENMSQTANQLGVKVDVTKEVSAEDLMKMSQEGLNFNQMATVSQLSGLSGLSNSDILEKFKTDNGFSDLSNGLGLDSSKLQEYFTAGKLPNLSDFTQNPELKLPAMPDNKNLSEIFKQSGKEMPQLPTGSELKLPDLSEGSDFKFPDGTEMQMPDIKNDSRFQMPELPSPSELPMPDLQDAANSKLSELKNDPRFQMPALPNPSELKMPELPTLPNKQ